MQRFDAASAIVVKGRIKDGLLALSTAIHRVEDLIGDKFFDTAPFQSVFVMVAFSKQTNLRPKQLRAKKQALDVQVEVNIAKVGMAQPQPPELDELTQILEYVLLSTLTYVAEKYDLEHGAIRERRVVLEAVWTRRFPAEEVPVAEPTSLVEDANVALEEVVITLLKGQRYWQIWIDENDCVLHEGKIGTKGKWHVEEFENVESAKARMVQLIQSQTVDGFVVPNPESLATVLVQYQIVGPGEVNDLDRRNQAMDLIDEYLQETGNGGCEGADIGAGTANIFCQVYDVVAAQKGIVKLLGAKGLLENVVIAEEVEDEYRVLFPQGAEVF